MKLLIFGGRDFKDLKRLEHELLLLMDEYKITHIIHGNALGADTIAGRLARKHGIQEVICPANWELQGKGAGHIRNKAMALLGPDMAIKCPGGRGTQVMFDLCNYHGIEVRNICCP